MADLGNVIRVAPRRTSATNPPDIACRAPFVLTPFDECSEGKGAGIQR
jgi:hypothetical protein